MTPIARLVSPARYGVATAVDFNSVLSSLCFSSFGILLSDRLVALGIQSKRMGGILVGSTQRSDILLLNSKGTKEIVWLSNYRVSILFCGVI